MAKLIPARYDNEGAFAYMRRLIAEFPKMSMTQVKGIIAGRKRIRNSAYKPHYGARASSRNFEHAINGTHGLIFRDSKPTFA